jgi:predicted RNase H-like HicB family nuclease
VAKKQRQLTAVYQKRGRGYIGWIEEIPGANTQGTTFSEVKENLKEAASLIIEANQVLTKSLKGAVIRESLRVSA